jgi:8-oxo-dGTP pyrophosphatase MutT (NUDIX family)
LELGEDPFLGLKREAKEETNLDIDIISPLHIQHFTRDDGQKITMLIFFCKPGSTNIKLSEEHTEHSWVNLSQKEKIPSWLSEPCDNFEKYYIKN